MYVIVHVLPQNIIDTDNAVSPTPLLSLMSSNTASTSPSSSSCSSKSVPFSSVSAIYYPRKCSISDKSMFGYIDVNEPNKYSPEVWQISSEESVHNATFDISPHTLLWTNKGAVVTIESLLMFVYFYTYSVCVNLWKVENEVSSFFINTRSIHKTCYVDWFWPSSKKKKKKKNYFSHYMHKTHISVLFFSVCAVISFFIFFLQSYFLKYQLFSISAF
jgi:hypothetical protein